MVEATVPPEVFQEAAKVALETRVKYPAYIKKIVDIGGNSVNYAIYRVDNDKVPDALKIICARYMKIAATVPGYAFGTEVMLDSDDWIASMQ